MRDHPPPDDSLFPVTPDEPPDNFLNDQPSDDSLFAVTTHPDDPHRLAVNAKRQWRESPA